MDHSIENADLCNQVLRVEEKHSSEGQHGTVHAKKEKKRKNERLSGHDGYLGLAKSLFTHLTN